MTPMTMPASSGVAIQMAVPAESMESGVPRRRLTRTPIHPELSAMTMNTTRRTLELTEGAPLEGHVSPMSIL